MWPLGTLTDMAAMKQLRILLILTIMANVKLQCAAEKRTSKSRSSIPYILTVPSAQIILHDVQSTSATFLPRKNNPQNEAFNPSSTVTGWEPQPSENINENLLAGNWHDAYESGEDTTHNDFSENLNNRQIDSSSVSQLSPSVKKVITNNKQADCPNGCRAPHVESEVREESPTAATLLDHHKTSSDQEIDVSNDYELEHAQQFQFGRIKVQECTSRKVHVESPSNVDSTYYERQISCNVTQFAIDCSCRDLVNVPNFNHSKEVRTFNLHNNIITALHNLTFLSYTELRILDLSLNRISVLEVNAFVGLISLRVLNLQRNNLTMTTGTFPSDVFKPLFSLQILWINENNPQPRYNNYTYPEKALSCLKNLTSLHMDGLRSQDFGKGFGQLTSLTNLSLTGYHTYYCWIHSLSNTTFRYLRQLKHLDMSHCNILGEKIESGAFLPLTNLISLNLTHSKYIDINFLDNVFYGLRQIPTLKELSMRLIVDRYSLGICLDSYYIRNLPQHLEYLDFGENNLEAVDRNVIRLLSPSLKRLDVSGNRFVFGTYLKDFKYMENLTEFKFNAPDFTYNLPHRYPFPRTGLYSHHMVTKTGKSNCTLYAEDDPMHDNDDDTFILVLPPNLKRIEMYKAGFNYIFSALTVAPNNSLEELIMQHNDFPNLNGPVIGLHKLRHLDLSRSFVRTISLEFFRNLTSLRKLNLGDNLLGDFLLMFRYDSGSIFSALNNLIFLNLSSNDISCMPNNVFQGLYSLKTLLLGKNDIDYLAANLSFMNNLQVLDLQGNRISFLPVFTREHIQTLLNNHIKVEVSLRNCPIMCDCSNLQFLTWMTTSEAFDQRFEHYRCQYPDTSSKVILDGYNSTILLLTRECTPHTIIFFIVGACMFVIICVIMCAILYRFRWKIRYLYYAAYLHYKRKGNNSEEHFEYDAFISYDEEDMNFVVRKLTSELERRGLKLCIHGRDFRAGEYIASNIVRAVCASRRTVVVLTRHMMNSYWCGYEIQMANMESVHTGRPVLIFLLMEKIPESELGLELLYNIRNNTYIPYPDPLPDATSIGRLWDKLTADILS